jgi:hypothetical protein
VLCDDTSVSLAFLAAILYTANSMNGSAEYLMNVCSLALGRWDSLSANSMVG